MAASFLAENCKVVQAGTNSASVSTTTTRTINAGEWIVVAVSYIWSTHDVGSTCTVGGLSLTKDIHQHNNPQGVELWSASASSTIASGSTVTFTTLSSSTGYMSFSCFSLQNISGLDTTGFSSGSSGTASTGTATNSQADSVAVAAGSVASSSAMTVGGSYTLIDTLTDSVQGNNGEADYLNLSSTGSQSASWTNGATTWVAVIGIYKGLVAAAAGPGFYPPRMPLGA